MDLKRIIKNRVIAPCKNLSKDIHYHNYKIGIYRFYSAVLRGTKTAKNAEIHLQERIYHKLFQDHTDIIKRYKDYHVDCCYDSNAPVWVLWMQGYDAAPVIVKKCIDSIKESTNHPVCIITSDNVSKYCDFPDYIYEKYEKGFITKAQFSDILRMTLLAEYGGLWIDATVFVPNNIPEEVFLTDFYTCKRTVKVFGYVSQYRWTSFLNGCQKGCVIQKAAKDLFFAYWEKNDYLIDYLLVDYLISLIYDNIPKAKRLIDELPYNNPQVEELQNRMNMVYDEPSYLNLINYSDTFFFKLSWRMDFERYRDGKMTYYGKLINGNKGI